jgi:hypothetical protein
MAAEAGLASDLADEVAAREAAVSAEEIARMAEDETLVKLDGSRIMTGSLGMEGGGTFNSSDPGTGA